MRRLHSFAAFLGKTTPCFREYWPWLGYSFILFIAIFLESNISFKLFNFQNCCWFDWKCAIWGSAGLPEKEPWIKRHYKEPNIKLQTNLTSQQLMIIAWQIAYGMSHLSSKFVSWKKKNKQRTLKIWLWYIIVSRTVLERLFFDTMLSLKTITPEKSERIRTIWFRACPMGIPSIFNVIIYYLSVFWSYFRQVTLSST